MFLVDVLSVASGGDMFLVDVLAILRLSLWL